jgi:protein ImuB
MRMLVAWYPDWPVVAAGCHQEVPAAVVRANQVVAVTAAGRLDGVRPGLRRREAQSRCPALEILPADAGRDARAWEPVVVALETLTPAVEILAPGAAALATRGPSRYFGGDEALARRVAEEVDRVVGQPGCRVGVADGRFTAGLAARAAGTGSQPVLVVPAGANPAWLAPRPVAALGSEFEALSDLLVRLGIRTLGDLAALPGPAVLGRFGRTGAVARDLAGGHDDRLLAARQPPPDLAVTAELDPPAERIDRAAFVAKTLADQLQGRLAALGLACTLVAIEAETEHGEQLVRRWRHEGVLTAATMAERARWQLDGWLMGEGRPSGGLTLLRLVPEEVRPDDGRQLRFWGGEAAADSRAARALARVQGMLGPEAVMTAVLAGGRAPAEQVRLVPWGDERVPEFNGRAPALDRPRRASGRTEVPPWPGRLVEPSPAVVYPLPLPMEVRDADGAPVGVSGRGVISAPPASVTFDRGRSLAVTGWAGPWPVEERWWDSGGRRKARLQVVLADGTAHLLTREGGRWRVEAAYE